MGFPESVLTADEKVVLHLHPHWKALVRPVAVVVLSAASLIAIGVFMDGGSRKWSLYGVGVLALGLVGWLSFWPWLVRRTTHYVFTNERVILREGVFSRDGRDIPLGRVNDVSFTHTLLGRMFGYGTLTIESGGERGQVPLVDIPGVEKVQSRLSELLEADRDRHTFGDDDRGALVREIRNDNVETSGKDEDKTRDLPA